MSDRTSPDQTSPDRTGPDRTGPDGTGPARTKRFQARTKKLLDLMIHSVYSDKEVFLRELISNASDAIDKVRFLALTDPGLAKGDHDYRIELRPDKEARTLAVIDNGVGMSEQEVIQNLGTIARSGTEEFLAKLAEAERGELGSDLIGRFGLGFYSAFMVADEVSVTTWKFGEEHGVRWSSRGGGTYTIERTSPGPRGTVVTLHLKPEPEPERTDRAADAESGTSAAWQDFTDDFVLRQIVKKHSDFVQWPIRMEVEKIDYEKDDEGKFDYDKPIKRREVETLNSRKALWTRPKSEITDEEYDDFYKHISRDWNKPADRFHIHVEGAREYTALMYLPERAPFDLHTRESKRGLSLYVKGVFIMEQCRELMPEYLRFVRGLVDSPDLPLNVSREMVQQDRIIASMRKVLTKKWLGHFESILREDRERYEKLWAEYGQALKEGYHYEPANKKRFDKLLLARSTRGDGWTTLAEYVERMKEGQEEIYYLAGEKLATLRESPALEGLEARGVEVLLFVDPVDEIMLGVLDDFDGNKIRDVARGDIDFDKLEAGEDKAGEGKAGEGKAGEGKAGEGKAGEAKAGEAKAGDEQAASDGADDKKAAADEGRRKDEARLEPLVKRLGEALGETVEEVRVSKRLKTSAAVLVTPEGGLSPQMERMMKAMGQEMPGQKRVLELNPEHALIGKLAELAREHADDDRIAAYGKLLYDQALISEGGQLENPAAFARRVADVMARAL